MALQHFVFLAIVTSAFLIWGSFLNVVAVRIMTSKSFLRGRSVCMNCGVKLSPIELVPIVSYILCRGKCRHCSSKISPLYLVIEFMTACLMGSLVMVANSPTEFGAYFVMLSILLISLRTDMEYMLVPTYLAIGGTAIGLLCSVMSIIPTSLPDSFFGAIVGFAIWGLINWICQVLAKQDGIGSGDAYIMAMIGSFIGWIGILLTWAVANCLAAAYVLILSIMGRKGGPRTKLPLVPFLTIATVIVMAFGTKFLALYQI